MTRKHAAGRVLAVQSLEVRERDVDRGVRSAGREAQQTFPAYFAQVCDLVVSDVDVTQPSHSQRLV